MDDSTKQQIDQSFEQGTLTEELIMGMAEQGAPEDEVEYAKGLLSGEEPQQEEGEPQQEEEDPRQAEEPAQPPQITPEDKQVAERFVTGVMTMAAGKGYEQMVGMAQSAKENKPEGFGRALFFILKGVKSALEGKSVEIPPHLWLAENGLVDQAAKLVSILLIKAGYELKPEEIQQGMAMATESLGADHEQGQQQEPPQQAPEQGALPPQQGMLQQQQQPPQQQAPQGLPPQGGLLQQGMPQ